MNAEKHYSFYDKAEKEIDQFEGLDSILIVVNFESFTEILDPRRFVYYTRDAFITDIGRVIRTIFKLVVLRVSLF